MLRPSSKVVAVMVAAVSSITVSWDEAAARLGESVVSSSQTRKILDECMAKVETVQAAKEISREEFALLVKNLSHGEIQGSYEELPLEFSTFFNMHACMNGRGCIGDGANISISNQDEKVLTCTTLASLLSQSMDPEGSN